MTRYRYTVQSDGTWENRKLFAFIPHGYADGTSFCLALEMGETPCELQLMTSGRRSLRYAGQRLLWYGRWSERVEYVGKVDWADTYGRAVCELPGECRGVWISVGTWRTRCEVFRRKFSTDRTLREGYGPMTDGEGRGRRVEGAEWMWTWMWILCNGL
jgi:hypothetical protein